MTMHQCTTSWLMSCSQSMACFSCVYHHNAQTSRPLSPFSLTTSERHGTWLITTQTSMTDSYTCWPLRPYLWGPSTLTIMRRAERCGATFQS